MARTRDDQLWSRRRVSEKPHRSWADIRKDRENREAPHDIWAEDPVRRKTIDNWYRPLWRLGKRWRFRSLVKYLLGLIDDLIKWRR